MTSSPAAGLPSPGATRSSGRSNALAGRFANVLQTQDWHPAEHISFASIPAASPSTASSSPMAARCCGPTTASSAAVAPISPRHAATAAVQAVIRKGFRPGIDSYSAFRENDHATPTGLAGYLRERGLPGCSCAASPPISASPGPAEDAIAAGFEAVIIEMPPAPSTPTALWPRRGRDMNAAGVGRVQVGDLI